MDLWDDPSIGLCFNLCPDHHYCLLMSYISALLLHLFMMSGHTNTVWPMSCLSTLPSSTVHALFLVQLLRLDVCYLAPCSLCLHSCGGLDWLLAPLGTSSSVMGLNCAFNSALVTSLLMAILSALWLHRFMVSGHKVTTLWTNASPMVQSFGTSATFEFCLLLIITAFAVCDLVLLVPLLVIIGKVYWRLRLLPSTLELPVWHHCLGGSLLVNCTWDITSWLYSAFASYGQVTASIDFLYKELVVFGWLLWLVSLLNLYFLSSITGFGHLVFPVALFFASSFNFFVYSSLSMVSGYQLRRLVPVASQVPLSLSHLCWTSCSLPFIYAMLRLHWYPGLSFIYGILVCCTGGTWFCLSLPHFHPFSFVWNMCWSLDARSFCSTSVFLDSVLQDSVLFTCWVWSSVFQLRYSSRSSPGSSLGLLLTWACCREDVDTLCLFLVMWLCVASSQAFRQHSAIVDKARDDMGFGKRLSEATFWLFSIPWQCFFISPDRHEAAACIDDLQCSEDFVLPRSEDSLWQWTLLPSFFFFIFLVCNVIVSAWNTLDCNNVFCLFFIYRWDGLYGTFRLCPAHFVVFRRVLCTVVTLYGLPFLFCFSSLSMVRGHKAQALWPVASPLNSVSGQSFSCIVNHMVGTLLFLCVVWPQWSLDKISLNYC